MRKAIRTRPTFSWKQSFVPHGLHVVSNQDEDIWGCFGTQYLYIVFEDSPKERFPYWSTYLLQFISWVFPLCLFQCILFMVEYGRLEGSKINSFPRFLKSRQDKCGWLQQITLVKVWVTVSHLYSLIKYCYILTCSSLIILYHYAR
jgi:hypothetical protein